MIAALDAASVVYLLTLLVAAATAREPRRRGGGAARGVRFAVLVPAHDEEREIPKVLRSLASQDYPHDLFVIVVIADNCHDRTAEIARGMGAVVYERSDVERLGKGHALAWGIERIRGAHPDIDAIAILDADCEPSANFLEEMAGHIANGAAGAQAQIQIGNPDEAWSAGLQAASFALIGEIQSRGRERLGLTARPRGTGTALTLDLLDRVPWDAFSPAEDAEYSARLVARGERFDHAGHAVVTTRAATALGATADQQRRWESGRWALLREWLPRHLAAGVRRRDARRLVAALELLAPAQSRLLVTSVTAAAAGRALSLRTVTRLAAFNLVGQIVFVFGGLWVAGAPRSVFYALVRAPLLAAWKVPLHVRGLAGRRPTRWIRGPRS